MPRFLALFVACLVLGACGNGKDNPSPGNHTEDDAGQRQTPAGMTLAPGFQDLDVPSCDNMLGTSCSGTCVTTSVGSNNCQAVGVAMIFSEMVSDANGIYVSQQASVHSNIYRLDSSSGTLVQLAAPEGDNQHVRLALTDDTLFFELRDALYGIPRAGGDVTTVLASVPTLDQMLVVNQRLFADVLSGPALAEVDLATGTLTNHELNITGMLRDGNDIYFTQADGIYRAPNAAFDAMETVASGLVAKLLGVAGDWLYILVGTEVRRLPKARGDSQVVLTLDTKGAVGLANDALVFTLPASDRVYICTAALDGTHPTIHGYLPVSSPKMLNADANFVYAVTGFNMLRFRR